MTKKKRSCKIGWASTHVGTKKGLKGNEAIKPLYLGFREIVKRRDAASKRMQEKVELDVTYCNYKIYRFDKNFLVFRTKM